MVAVDLIDQGSVNGLAEHAQVSVDYESATPRVAHVRGARREFARKNLKGVLVQGSEMVLVTALLLGGAVLFGRSVKNLLRAKG